MTEFENCLRQEHLDRISNVGMPKGGWRTSQKVIIMTFEMMRPVQGGLRSEKSQNWLSLGAQQSPNSLRKHSCKVAHLSKSHNYDF